MGVDPKLGPLASNGGPTQTMALLPGSPAVMAGDNSLIPVSVTTDQRGAPRIKDKIVDIGAFASGPETLVVTTLADSVDPAGPVMSLRDAMTFVDSVEPFDGDSIIFAAGLQGTIALSIGALPPIAADVAIDFRGSGVLTIDGKGVAGSGILTIEAGSSVDLFGLTLVNGSAARGGAILNTGGALALTDCTLSGDTATSGGAIYSTGTTSLTRCTLSGNSATSFGGAAFNFLGTMTLTECTVSGNMAKSSAGLDLIGGTNTLIACTVSANTGTSASSGFVAGIYILGTASLNNTIVSGNTGPSGASDIGGLGKASGSNNLIGTGLVSGSHNLLGVTNPMLGPLMFNGGPTQTMLPGATSPAIDKGDKTLLPLGVITDQRGARASRVPT